MDNMLAIVGASGVGKTTIIQELEKTGKYENIRPVTTRPYRAGDDTKISVSLEEFNRKRAAGDLFCVNSVYDNWYAYSKANVKKILHAGKIPVCDLIIDAIEGLRAERPDIRILTVYVAPPSVEELKRRLGSRFNEARFRKDIVDMERARQDRNIDHYIVNDDYHRATQEIRDILEH